MNTIEFFFLSGLSSPSHINVSLNIQVSSEKDAPGNSTPPVDPGVVRNLFETRNKILAARRRQQEEEDEEEEDSDSDSSYAPSKQASDDSVEGAEDASDQDHETTPTPEKQPDSRAADQEDRIGGDDEQMTPTQGNNDDNDDSMAGSDSGEEDDPEDCQPKRKRRRKVRVRQTTSSSRRERQIARNNGQSYTTSSGKLIPAKESVPLLTPGKDLCRKKCALKVEDEQCSEICRDFWGLGKIELRTTYLSNLIEVNTKASQKLRHNVSPQKRRNRKLTMEYHLVVRGQNVPVCRGCFIKVFQVTPKFIELIIRKKMGSIAGVMPSEETRGRSSSGLSEEHRECVREHLNSFPRYKSHYARNKTDKQFLPSNLTMKIMFEEYLIKFPDNKVSRWIYEQEFHAMNLRIKPMKADTCNKCDTLQKAVLYASTEEKKKEAKLRQELHHRKAEKARNEKEKDITEAKQDKTKGVIAFDLQQCLPTPFLQTSIVFYKRQLWVYNLTIHDCVTGKSVHSMWHEGEAERGPNEVGSALFKYLMDLPENVQEITLWSDTCGGQNKNSIICAVLQVVLQRKSSLQVINQKFLVSGHTYLDCDTDHSVIEGKKQNAEGIHVPRDWYALVRNASKKFSVTVMGQSLQLNFKSLLKGRDSPLVKRKKNTDKEKFVWKEVQWLQHSRDFPPGTLAYKATHDKDSPFSYLNIKRKKKGPLELSPALTYDGPRLIKQKKKDDLMELVHLIDPECRSFYRHLRGDDEEVIDECDTDPDILPTTDEEESGEED